MRLWLITLAALAGCAAEPDWNAAAQQALADGRASLAAVGAPAPAQQPVPREPARLRPLRTAGLPPADPPAGLPATPGLATGGSRPTSAATLNGSPPEALVALLGEPSLRRAEGPVSIWLYSAAGCQLDVMFYPGVHGPRVAHIQARAGGFAQRTEAACLRDLAAGARRREGRMPVLEPVG